MLLWLKVGSLMGVRDVSAADFRWSYVVIAMIGGTLFALAAQALWGVVAAAAFRLGGRTVRSRELRLVWGAASFPQLAALVVLLPIDLLIVGPETFTSTKLTDQLATGWAAISIALGASLGVWSFYLFARGIQVATRSSWASSGAGVLLGAACVLAIVVAVVVVVQPLAGP